MQAQQRLRKNVLRVSLRLDRTHSGYQEDSVPAWVEAQAFWARLNTASKPLRIQWSKWTLSVVQEVEVSESMKLAKNENGRLNGAKKMINPLDSPAAAMQCAAG